MEAISLPRMRGIDPPVGVTPTVFAWFTPHARGSTIIPLPGKLKDTVYPACAGIDRGAEQIL